MIFGVGIDCIEVARMAANVAGESAFAAKVFTVRERAYCMARHDPAQHFAARFAAKEAVFKALGTGWSGGMAWQEIEIVHDEGGRPRVEVSGAVAEYVARHGITRIHVSLTHTREVACAFAVAETESI